MDSIKFNVDKKQVAEQEYVTVSWECRSPDQVTLTVEDGTRTVHQLADSGSRVVQASGNADVMTLTLRASIAGKTHEKTLSVKVKRTVYEGEKVHDTPFGKKAHGSSSGNGSAFGKNRSGGSSQGPFRQDSYDKGNYSSNGDGVIGKVKAWWNRTTSRLKMAWTYLPETKKLALKILALLWGIMILISAFPKLFTYGFLILLAYLTWVVLKR